MDIQTLEIVQTANKLVDTLGTRDPHRIARELGIEVVPVDFKRLPFDVEHRVQSRGA